MKNLATSFILPRAVCTTIVLAVALAVATPCRAQSSSSFGSAIEDYFINWFPRVTQIQSEQPHWVTPLVTVTPRLEEEVRYDQFFQSSKNGLATDNFGGGKGLELIPFQNTEIIVGMPRVPEPQHAEQHRRLRRLAVPGEGAAALLQRGARQLHRHRLHGVQRADRLERQRQRARALHADAGGRQRLRRLRRPIDGRRHVPQRRSRHSRPAGDAAGLEYHLPVSPLQIFLAGV